jgi:hypothetical protein
MYEPTKYLGIKTAYTPRAVIPLVNIFNCLTFDWTVKDICKVTSYDQQRDVVRW